MTKLRIKTHRKREILDISDRIEEVIRANHGIASGLCQINVLHTTAAITTADLDPGTDLDMLDAFEQIIPEAEVPASSRSGPRSRPHSVDADRNFAGRNGAARRPGTRHMAACRSGRAGRPPGARCAGGIS